MLLEFLPENMARYEDIEASAGIETGQLYIGFEEKWAGVWKDLELACSSSYNTKGIEDYT